MAEETNTAAATMPVGTAQSAVLLPRVTIQFCTQCKWMLRAAYYAQELLSTFSTALGEVALQPSTGGTFVVEIVYSPALVVSTDATDIAASSQSQPVEIQRRVLWDRKVDGGFPETKELKRRVRDVIEPGRNLGHVDRDYGSGKGKKEGSEKQASTAISSEDGSDKKDCEDCK